MTPLRLSSRLIARRRRLVLRALIPLGFASFVGVLSAALLGEVSAQLEEHQRTASGELVAVEQISSKDRTRIGLLEKADTMVPTVIRNDESLLASVAIVVPAVVGDGAERRAATLWYTDVPTELEFRTPMRPHEPGPAVESDAETDQNNSSEPVLVSIPGATAGVVAGWIGIRGPVGTDELLVPLEGLPEIADPESFSGHFVVRVRGERALPDEHVDLLSGETGLRRTEWQFAARSRMRDLRIIALTVILILFGTSAIAGAPAFRIVVKQYEGDFWLLEAMGYSSRFNRRIVLAAGAVSGAAVSAVASIAAALVLSIGNLRGGFGVGLLPLYWQAANPVIQQISPAPPIAPMILAIAAATAVGALAAVPAALESGRAAAENSRL